MKNLKTTGAKTIAAFGVAGMLAAMALGGCSSSTGSAPTATSTQTTEVTSAPETSTPTATETTAAPSQSAAAGDVESLQREGSLAQWKGVTVAGTSTRALVPEAASSAGGSIVFKGTESLQTFSFSAATPDGVEGAAPLIVKVFTADESAPEMVTVNPGSKQTVSVPVNGSQMVKIVWNVKGEPAAGENIAFFDFDVN